MTLSILARALEVVPPERALALHLDFMGTAEPIWTTARLHDRWWALIDRLPKMAHAVADLATETTMLLREYLDWLEGPGFGQKGTMLDDVIGRYGELLHRLQVLREYHHLSLLLSLLYLPWTLLLLTVLLTPQRSPAQLREKDVGSISFSACVCS